jgi:hypothetical protein
MSSNQVASTSTQNIVPVQAEFNAAGQCLGLVGPGGAYFSPPLTSSAITGATISASTITTSTITAPTVTAPVISLRVTTEAALGAIANAINTAGKAQGSIVFTSDTNAIYVSAGSTAGALWYLADGTTPITPA